MLLYLFLSFISSEADPYTAEFQTYLIKGAFNPKLHVPPARFQNSTIITNTQMPSGNRDRYAYFRCEIQLNKVKFQSCFAYGAGYTFGSGGAIYLSASNMAAQNCSFISNKALIGGAVSSVAGNVYITTNSYFISNTAFKRAGALSITYSEFGIYTEIDNNIPTPVTPVEPSLQISDVFFIDNNCQEFCGALLVSKVSLASLSNVRFVGNRAGNAGGALWVTQSSITLYTCSFYDNICGKGFFNATTKFQYKEMQKNSPYRGGGAILFDVPFNNTQTLQLTTVQCCFASNGYLQTYDFGAKGLDVYFHFGSGALNERITDFSTANWVSQNDVFNQTKDLAYRYLGGIVYLSDSNTTFNSPYGEGVCNGFATLPFVTPTPESTTIFTYAPPIEYSETAEPEPTPLPTVIPNPTEPKATIKVNPPPTANLPPPTPVPTMIPIRTPIRTPEMSPAQSEDGSPYPTTPLNTLARTPIRTPNRTEIRTLEQTLLETPKISPAKTLSYTFLPSTLPATPDQTGLTPFITPINSPGTTVLNTLQRSLEFTPVNSPEITPIRTEIATPIITIDFTIIPTFEKTPIITIERTLINTFVETLQETIKRTPEASPVITPHATLQETPIPSPISTPELSKTPPPLKPGESRVIVSFSRTISIMYISEISTTQSLTLFPSLSFSGGQSITIYTYSLTQLISYTYKEVTIPVMFSTSYLLIGTEFPTEESSSLGSLIAIIIGVILALLAMAVLIWFFLFKDREVSSSPSCAEMEEETVIQVIDSMSAPITNDNPLWTTSVMGDTDDPFRDDFEEDGAEFLTLQPDVR